jgi:hypothetical protein
MHAFLSKTGIGKNAIEKERRVSDWTATYIPLFIFEVETSTGDRCSDFKNIFVKKLGKQFERFLFVKKN